MNELGAILKKATAEELRGLSDLLDPDFDLFLLPVFEPGSDLSRFLETDRGREVYIDLIGCSFEDESQSVFGSFFGPDRSYREIVAQAADKLDVWYPRYETSAEIEVRIARKVFETVWEKMTPAQRQQMEEELKKTAQKFDKGGGLIGSASMFGALTAAQLSGFGVYLLASTSLGAVTATLGVTLPFAVYTTMSSTIAVLIGPVGWIGAGLFTIWKLTGPNYKRLIPAILYVAMLRSKQSEQTGDGPGEG